MNPFFLIAAGGALLAGKGWLDRMEAEAERERRERGHLIMHNDVPCRFDGPIDSEGFTQLARKAAKRFRRIGSVDVDGAVVRCSVWSQSGATSWSFSVDYNDYGYLGSRYWLWKGNEESSIPHTYAEYLSTMISEKLAGTHYPDKVLFRCYDCGERMWTYRTNDVRRYDCPNCGSRHSV